MANASIYQLLQSGTGPSTADLIAQRQQQAREAELGSLQVEGTRRQNALAALAAQQQQDDRNALTRIASGWNAQTTPEQRIASLRNSGSLSLMQQADALEKQDLERRKTGADIGKTNAETADKQFGTAEAKRKSTIQQIVALNSPAEAKQLLEQQVQAGAIGMQAAQALSRMIDTDPKWQLRLVAGINDPKEMLAALQPHFQNAGGAFVNTNPLAGPVGQGQPNAIPITQSADNAATQATTRRGQDLTDRRARETNELTRQAQATVYDPERGVLVDKRTALARPAATMDGKPLAAKPSEAQKKELMSIGQQRAVIQGAINDVQQTPDAFSFSRGLATMGGPLSESIAGRFDSDRETQARSYLFNNVSSVINARAGAAQSAQELARLRAFLPAETDGADQIVSKLKAFETYLGDIEAGTRGMAPPSVTASTPAAGQPKQPARIADEAGYDALPSGATFIGPDGKTRRKP